PETCDKENVYQDRGIVSDCPMLHREGTVSTKRKKKPGGFNLRKSIAWNPAFFTEEGVLDNMELSVLSGSQMKANRSPGSGVGGIASPLCRFGRSGSSSVLKEVAENSHGRLLVKYRSAENKGRKLFSPAKTSDYTQKKVPNSNATAQMTRTPKKSSQPSVPMVPRSTSSTANISKSNRKLPPVKVEHSSRVEALQLKSKIKPTPLTKSSGSTTEKDMEPLVTATHEEGSSSRNCSSFSTHSQNNPSSFVGVPASTFAKPSALRMPSPSIGFFSQGKALVSHDDAAQGNTSSLVKPPRYKQPEHLKSRLYQASVLNGDTAQANAKLCFTRNTSSLVKPPRYKQPEDLKSRHSLTLQLPTNCPAASKPLVHPVTNQSTLDTLVSSLLVLEHANVCSGKESLSKGAITCSAYSRNANNQPTRKVDCSSAGSGDTTPSSSSEKNGASRNGVLNAYSVASHVEETGIINSTGPNKDSHSLRAICSSTTEHGEDSCSHEATGSSMDPIAVIRLSSSCISSQVCTLNDLNCQSKSDSSACLAIDLKNSLAGEKMVAVSLSEDNSCTPGPDFLREFDSRNQQNTECSTLRKSVESTTSADQVPQFGNPLDTEPASSDSTTDLHGSLCNEAELNSAEEPNTDGGAEFDSDSPPIGNELQLIIGCESDHDYRSTECSPMEPAVPVPCINLSDLEEVTLDCKTEAHDSLAVERRSALLEEPNAEDDMDLDTNELSALEDASPIGKNKAAHKSGANTILKDHLKQLVPFSEEWLAAMEACGEEVLEQKSGAVQNSPTDKTTPEPSPWSPVKRKAQDVGPFDCTKYSKSVRTSDTP
uniref:Uncharacterized protein n=1 Tax=Aegilops tauschii subsp. strangulata TaxID=200361 RepID=A0A453KEY5_AEGTS